MCPNNEEKVLKKARKCILEENADKIGRNCSLTYQKKAVPLHRQTELIIKKITIMRQRLLQHLSFAKPLRLALVLFTLLLTQTAWGQGQTEVTYTFGGLQNSTDPNYNYTITSGSAGGSKEWKIKNFAVAPSGRSYSTSTTTLGFSSIPYYSSSNPDPSTTISFDLISDFTLTGNFVSAEITYTTDNMNSQTVSIQKDITTTWVALTNDNIVMNTSPASIPNTRDDKTFSGNGIVFHFSFTTNTVTSGIEPQYASFEIQSIKITTTDAYGITVAGTNLTLSNATTGITAGSGKVYFDSNTNTLTLDGAVINGEIESSYNNFKVYLKGNSEINVSDNTKAPFKYIGANNTGNLTFESSEADDGELTLSGAYTASGSTPNITINSGGYNTTNLFDKGYAADFGNWIMDSPKIYYNPHYGITVNGYQTTKFNKNDITKVGGTSIFTYSPQDKALSIPSDYSSTGATIISQRDDLTVLISGNTTFGSITHDQSVSGTLTFKKNPSSTAAINKITLENNSGVISGFTSVSLSDPLKILTPNRTIGSISSWGSTVTKAIFSDETVYDLWIGDTRVSEQNKTDVLNDTKIIFTPATGTTPNILALNTANITGMIESGLGNLTIHLTGTNIIQQSNNETNLITSSNSGVLTFETDATPGDLSFLNSGNPSSVFSGTPFSGFSNIVYGTGIDYDDTNKKICNISYPLTVAGTTVTSLNKNGVLGDNKVTFDPSSNTITLNGATINGNSGIVYNGTTDFTIALNGSNSIVNTNGNYAIVTNTTTSYSLKFEKATNASTAELALKWATGDKAISANDSILGSGLYWKPIAATQMTITDNPEFVIVGDYAISDGTPVNGATSGTITYNATDKLLTISSFSETYDKDAIRTGVSGLKVKLVGESVITCNTYDKRAFTAFTTSASIQFVKNDANSKLTMSTTLDPLYGFAAGAITYDGLFYYYAGNNKYIIRPKFSPTIKFVTRNQTDGSIPTTQSAYVYVPDNSTIPLTYGTDFYAPKPVFNDGYVLTDSTRYVYSMSVDGVVEFELGGTDYHNSDKILYADNGKLNILKSGELTITCSFPGNDENEPCSASYTLKITRDFNNPFANQPAEQIYATYYNRDEDLTLPDGIAAYVITGISGNTVTTTATGYLPHEVPVLLEKTGNVGTTITGYTGSAGNFSGNLLKYADQTFSSTGKEYVLYMNEFVKATGDIPDPKCYLDLSSVNPTRGMYGIGDGSTSIRELRMENEERDEWYDLQGRRIEQPTKAGLYIKNGKKVIVNIK